MRSYSEALAFLRTRSDRKVAGNTYLRHDGEDCVLSFHGTDIVRYHPDGTCTLNTSGYRTVTTKRRLNEYSPISIYQRDGKWLFCFSVKGEYYPVPFWDGITIGPDSVPTDPIIQDMLADRAGEMMVLSRCQELAELQQIMC